MSEKEVLFLCNNVVMDQKPPKPPTFSLFVDFRESLCDQKMLTVLSFMWFIVVFLCYILSTGC